MTLSLDPDRSGDIAVLHGVDSEAALAHLGRSIATGVAFDNYRALVVDFDSPNEIPTPLARDLAEAATACEHRHRQFVVASGPAGVDHAMRDVRRWINLVDGRSTASSVATGGRILVGLVGTAAGWSINAVRAAIKR